MKSIIASFALVVLAAVCHATETNVLRSTALPGSSSTIAVLIPYTSNIVVAVAQSEATITRRHSSHISTVMDMGGGETIEGGGTVTYAECRQTFTVSEVLAGSIFTGKADLTYGFAEESDAFPGPSQEIAIPSKTEVILLLGDKFRVLKAIRDTQVNRNLVKSELKKADKKSAQQDKSSVRGKPRR